MAQQYKLKLDSIDLKHLEKREVEVEGIDGAKVLLVKLGDQVHALSSNCTHYGAPLVKGVITPDGRLTCPWHGGRVLDLVAFYAVPDEAPALPAVLADRNLSLLLSLGRGYL
jgi:hypothetical protein